MKKLFGMILSLLVSVSLLIGCTGPAVQIDPTGQPTQGVKNPTQGIEGQGVKTQGMSPEEYEALIKELDKYFDMKKLEKEMEWESPLNSLPVMEAADGGYFYVEKGLEGSLEGGRKGVLGTLPNGCLVYFREFNTEEYAYYAENGFQSVVKSPLSTFAADVDTGSYTNLRRYIRNHIGISGIPAGLLRYEEMINYFDYEVLPAAHDDIAEPPREDGRFSVGYRLGECPWNPDHSLLMMTVKANEVEIQEAPGNYVFLIDVSGSMAQDDRIALAMKSFALLARTLGENDMVSIVTYSGASTTLLDSCPAKDVEKIFEALREAESYCVNWGGGTNGSGGITAAYKLAEKNFVEGGNNRVIIASDGDMNLGITGTAGLVELITREKEKGIFLTTLGFGEGNYSDTNMEQIADAGNGNYYYIDCIDEAQRVLVEKIRETTITVAKDVKFQIEFNPREVAEYKLIGYENRVMSADDFEDDAKDGGEVGAGQAVTVLYEIVPAGGKEAEGKLRYQDLSLSDRAESGEIGTLAIRYKEPDGEKSALEEIPIRSGEATLSEEDFHFAAAVVMAGMVINESADKGGATLEAAIALAEKNTGGDASREGFVTMMRDLKHNTDSFEEEPFPGIIDDPTLPLEPDDAKAP